MLKLKEMAAKRRAEREVAEKAQAIVREKERKRGQKMAETDESREKTERAREGQVEEGKSDAAAEKRRHGRN